MGLPGERTSKHLGTVPPGLSVEDQLLHLKEYVAQLWDQVWWLSLSPEKRAEYEAEGHTHPIAKFYEPEDHESTKPK